jgi:single-stranded DNA-binding protein
MVNSISILGRLGADPVIKPVIKRDNSTVNVTTLRIADNNYASGTIQTNWITCEIWGERFTEMVKKLKKAPLTNNYKNKEGLTVTNLKLDVRSLNFGIEDKLPTDNFNNQMEEMNHSEDDELGTITPPQTKRRKQK